MCECATRSERNSYRGEQQLAGFHTRKCFRGISSVKLSYFLFVYQETNQAKHKRRAIAKVGYY